jgi:hypothetical protein
VEHQSKHQLAIGLDAAEVVWILLVETAALVLNVVAVDIAAVVVELTRLQMGEDLEALVVVVVLQCLRPNPTPGTRQSWHQTPERTLGTLQALMTPQPQPLFQRRVALFRKAVQR